MRLDRVPFAALCVVATLLVLAANLAGSMCFELLDVDEPRFATASRHLLRSGDWLVPHFNGAERLDKPIFVYWLQAACMAVLGPTEFAARLPSALAVAIAVPATASIGRTLGLRPVFAIVAGVAVATCGASQALAHGATADATLLGLTAWSSKAMVDVFASRAGRLAGTAAWVLAALAFLTKGPPALVSPLALVAGMVAGGWRPRPSRLLAGALLFCAIVAAWAIPALVRTEGRFWSIGVMHHVVDRSLQAFEGHGGHAPWWYLFYLGAVPLAFLPWTPFLCALRSGPRLREQALPGSAKLLAWWFLLTIAIFSLATSKLAHYPLPGFPALAIATAFAMQARTTPDRCTGALLIALGVIAGIATIAAFPLAGLTLEVPVVLTAATIAVGFTGAGRLAMRGRSAAAGLAAAMTAIGGAGALGAMVVPLLAPHTAIHALRDAIPSVFPPQVRVATCALSMPSLVFYLDRDVPALEPPDALAFLFEQDRVIVTTRDRLNRLEEAIDTLAPERRDAARTLLRSPKHVVRGFLTNKGKVVDVVVLGS